MANETGAGKNNITVIDCNNYWKVIDLWDDSMNMF